MYTSDNSVAPNYFHSFYIPTGDCKDRVNRKNYIIAQGKKLTSCKPLEYCYIRFCDVYGGENGICCETCRKRKLGRKTIT